MDLQFIGLGSCFNPAMENTNAYFTIGKKLFLIDCGETAYPIHWKLPELKCCNEISVVITHLHADHCGSLGSLISYCYYILQKKITVYHPLETIVQLLDLMGINHECYTWVSKFPSNEEVSFESIEVEHVTNMICFGYIITTKDWKVYISGDAVTVPTQIIDMLSKGSLDKIYQDTSLSTGHCPTHCSLSSLEELFSPEIRHKVHCIHLDSDCRDIIRKKGFSLPDGY